MKSARWNLLNRIWTAPMAVTVTTALTATTTTTAMTITTATTAMTELVFLHTPYPLQTNQTTPTTSLGTFFGQTGQQKPGVARPTPLRLGTPLAASPPRELLFRENVHPSVGLPVRTPPRGFSAAPLILASRV